MTTWPTKWPQSRVTAAKKRLKRITMAGKLPSPNELHDAIQRLPVVKRASAGHASTLDLLELGYALYVMIVRSGHEAKYLEALRKDQGIKRSDAKALTTIMRSVNPMPAATLEQRRKADRACAVMGLQVGHLIRNLVPFSKINRWRNSPGRVSPLGNNARERSARERH
jgi:hypothetical protein